MVKIGVDRRCILLATMARQKKDRKVNGAGSARTARRKKDGPGFGPRSALLTLVPREEKTGKASTESGDDSLLKEALGLIREAQQGKSSLLVVTTDASINHGYSGMAAVLRKIGVKSGGVDGVVHDGETENGNNLPDRVKVVIGQVNWEEITPAEIAAQAMGMEAALKDSSVCSGVENILLLTDNKKAIQFYSPAGEKTKLEKALRDAPVYQRSMKRLVESCAGKVILCHVKSTHHKTNTFFDHVAADIFAKMATDTQSVRQFSHDWVDSPALTELDLNWLTDFRAAKEELRTRQKWIKKRGASRKTNCIARIKEEYGIALDSRILKRNWKGIALDQPKGRTRKRDQDACSALDPPRVRKRRKKDHKDQSPCSSGIVTRSSARIIPLDSAGEKRLKKDHKKGDQRRSDALDKPSVRKKRSKRDCNAHVALDAKRVRKRSRNDRKKDHLHRSSGVITTSRVASDTPRVRGTTTTDHEKDHPPSSHHMITRSRGAPNIDDETDHNQTSPLVIARSHLSPWIALQSKTAKRKHNKDHPMTTRARAQIASRSPEGQADTQNA